MLKKSIIISSIFFVFYIISILLDPLPHRIIKIWDFLLPAVILGLIYVNKQITQDSRIKAVGSLIFIDIGFFFALFLSIFYLANLELLILIKVFFILLVIGSFIHKRKIIFCLLQIIFIPLLLTLIERILKEGGFVFDYPMFGFIVTILLPFFLLLMLIFTGDNLFSEQSNDCNNESGSASDQ